LCRVLVRSFDHHHAHDETNLECHCGKLRYQVKILVGGAPVTQAFAEEIGADGFAAGAASKLAKSLVN